MKWHEGNPDIIHDAELARAAYSGASEVHGWQKDLELSNEDRAVYHKGGKAKVVFRGTDPNNKRDLGTDLLISLGLERFSSRVRNSKKTTDLAAAKYGKENISLTGHSLGGSLAANISSATGISATGFNTAMSPLELVKKRNFSKFHSISTAADPISAITQHYMTGIGKKTTVAMKEANPHGLGHYR